MYKIYHIFIIFNTNDLTAGEYFTLFDFRILLSTPLIDSEVLF